MSDLMMRVVYACVAEPCCFNFFFWVQIAQKAVKVQNSHTPQLQCSFAVSSSKASVPTIAYCQADHDNLQPVSVLVRYSELFFKTD